MKTKIYAVLLTLLFVISSPSAVSSELYRVNLHDANFARNYKIKAALEKASAEISARGMSIIRPAAAADLESTQQLYYFIDDIRSLKILETEP
jgi:hypothetical protein